MSAPAKPQPVKPEMPTELRNVLMVLDQQLTAVLDVVLSEEMAFPKYKNDLSFAQTDAFMSQLDAVRAQLKESADALGGDPAGQAHKLSAMARELLTKAQVAVTEYGLARGASAAEEGDLRICELGRALRRMAAILEDRGQKDLSERALQASMKHPRHVSLPPHPRKRT